MLKSEKVWNALNTSIIEVLPECASQNIHLEDTLQELGANSIDRVEIITLTLARLKLKVPLVDFALAKNISGLIQIFSRTLSHMESSEHVNEL